MKFKDQIPKLIKSNKIISELIYAKPPSKDKEFLIQEKYFDSKGNLIEAKKFKRGQLENWSKYVYRKNRLIETNNLVCNSIKKSFLSKHEYDNEGNPVLRYNPVFEMDENGDKIEKTYFDNGKIRTSKTKNLPDENIEHWYRGGKVFKEIITKMNGLLIRETERDTTDNVIILKSCEYDETGKLIGYRENNSIYGSRIYRQYFYDNLNRIILEKDISDVTISAADIEVDKSLIDFLPSTLQYEYLPNNLFKSIQFFKGDFLLMTYEYKYTFQ